MSKLKKTMMGLGLALLFVTATATRSEALAITVADGNSVAEVNADDTSGMNSWLVDGVEQLFTQWFWYRLGDAGPERSIDNISAAIGGAMDVDFDGDLETAFIRFENPTLKVEIIYTLSGGSIGSGVAGITENIKITNKTQNPMILDFFQYSDFDLGGDPADDSANVTGSCNNTARQYDSDNGYMEESVVSPCPSKAEVALFDQTFSKLEDGDLDDLNNVTTAGPGDVTWAYQWEQELLAGSTLIIKKGKDIHPMPEPASLVIFGMGLIGAATAARRRKVLAPTV